MLLDTFLNRYLLALAELADTFFAAVYLDGRRGVLRRAPHKQCELGCTSLKYHDYSSDGEYARGLQADLTQLSL